MLSPTAQIPIIEVYFNGIKRTLVVDGSDSRSYFGGPHQDHVETTVDLEQAAIHHVATLNLPRMGVGNPSFGFSIPLFYGLCHEGCTLEYRKIATGAVEITALNPLEAEEGYPYHAYPPMLPFYHLGIGAAADHRAEELSDRIHNTGWKPRGDCLYAIVMQHPTIGHCLFEPGLDVEIVFEYDPSKGTFRATNQCS